MNNRGPKVFVNNINKINNNEEVYYSYKDTSSFSSFDENECDVRGKITEIFNSNSFVYKKNVYIRTKYGEGVYVIVSHTYDYLLCIDGEKIYINNIVEIR